MKTLTRLDDIQIGSLLHRADGSCFYLIYQDDAIWAYYAVNADQ